jgi:hypothetical protein
MAQTTRQQRIRHLVRRVNRQRKQQARQIDILCNDLIGAQREFIRRLGTLSFATTYYRSILGVTDVETLFDKTGQSLQGLFPEAHIVFCRPGHEPWRYHADRRGPSLGDLNLEQYLDATVIASISQCNRSCDAEDMLAFGLQVNPCILAACKAVTIPITDAGRTQGFILLYHHGHAFQVPELAPVAAMAGGLGRALAAAVYSADANT